MPFASAGWPYIGILMRLLAAEPPSTAGRVLPSQCLCGMILIASEADNIHAS